MSDSESDSASDQAAINGLAAVYTICTSVADNVKQEMRRNSVLFGLGLGLGLGATLIVAQYTASICATYHNAQI